MTPKSSGPVWDVTSTLYYRTFEVKAEWIPQVEQVRSEQQSLGLTLRGQKSWACELVKGKVRVRTARLCKWWKQKLWWQGQGKPLSERLEKSLRWQQNQREEGLPRRKISGFKCHRPKRTRRDRKPETCLLGPMCNYWRRNEPWR